MTISLKFYADAGLVAELANLDALFASDGSTTSRDFVVYLGSTATGRQFQDYTDPGVASLSLSVTDSAGGGGTASMIKLALSPAALDSATAGAPLDLGVSILSGPAGALPIHVRVTPGALALGTYADLALQLSSVVESAV